MKEVLKVSVVIFRYKRSPFFPFCYQKYQTLTERRIIAVRFVVQLRLKWFSSVYVVSSWVRLLYRAFRQDGLLFLVYSSVNGVYINLHLHLQLSSAIQRSALLILCTLPGRPLRIAHRPAGIHPIRTPPTTRPLCSRSTVVLAVLVYFISFQRKVV